MALHPARSSTARKPKELVLDAVALHPACEPKGGDFALQY